MTLRTGRHFLQIPGPTNVPDRVLRAMAAPTIDHRGPEFAELTKRLIGALKPVFGTAGPVVVYPASGTGAWEAALVNTLSPGDRVLSFETGHFAVLWREMARGLGLDADTDALPGDWRHGADPEALAERLAADTDHRIKAVCVVHNETSTGVTSRIPALRAAIDSVGHPALLFVDTISSLGSIDYRHDEWGVDVTVAGSQKGLMLPPGLSFNAVSDKALAASRTAGLPASFWRWQPIIDANAKGAFPYTCGHQPALRPGRGAAHAGGGGPGERLRPAHPARCRHPCRGAGLGTGGAVRRRARALRVAHRRPDARRTRRRQAPQDHPGALRHVTRLRPRKTHAAGSSASATSATSTT